MTVIIFDSIRCYFCSCLGALEMVDAKSVHVEQGHLFKKHFSSTDKFCFFIVIFKIFKVSHVWFNFVSRKSDTPKILHHLVKHQESANAFIGTSAISCTIHNS